MIERASENSVDPTTKRYRRKTRWARQLYNSKEKLTLRIGHTLKIPEEGETRPVATKWTNTVEKLYRQSKTNRKSKTPSELKDNVHHKIPHLQQMRTDTDASKRKTSCTSTDLRNSTVQSTELEVPDSKTDPQHELTKEDTSLIRKSSQGSGQSQQPSDQNSVETCTTTSDTQPGEGLVRQNWKRQHLNKVDISSVATDETTSNQELS